MFLYLRSFCYFLFFSLIATFDILLWSFATFWRRDNSTSFHYGLYKNHSFICWILELNLWIVSSICCKSIQRCWRCARCSTWSNKGQRSSPQSFRGRLFYHIQREIQKGIYLLNSLAFWSYTISNNLQFFHRCNISYPESYNIDP